jgi:hypothetical protein
MGGEDLYDIIDVTNICFMPHHKPNQSGLFSLCTLKWQRTRSYCCGLYYFCIRTMFGSSLPPFVCRRTHVLFTLFVFVCV